MVKNLLETGGYDSGTMEWYLLESGMPWIPTEDKNRRRMYDIVEKIVEKDLPIQNSISIDVSWITIKSSENPSTFSISANYLHE